jgi:uncharacterized protein
VHLIQELLNTLPEGEVEEIRVGAFWTTVVVQTETGRTAGLATAMKDADSHHHGSGPAVAAAGDLHKKDARALAALALSESCLESSIGLATINALLPKRDSDWVDLNAEQVVLERGVGKRVALVGHFPFIPHWREVAGTLWVLEKMPRGEDLPAEAAREIIPQADIVAITGTTLINKTFDELIPLCRPDALVLVLGPTTPLSPILFDYGVHLVSGSIVEDIPSVLAAVSQGANFRQVHRRGVRLVTMSAL